MESADVYAMVEKARAEGKAKAIEEYTRAVSKGDGSAALGFVDAVMFGDATHAFAKEIASLKPADESKEWPMVPMPLDQIAFIVQTSSTDI